MMMLVTALLFGSSAALHTEDQALLEQASVVGCSDGSREGFVDIAKYPNVAGCNGGWSIRGLSNFAPVVTPACPKFKPELTLSPRCNRVAGDDSKNPTGKGCAAEDLCAEGWHICLSEPDFFLNSGKRNCADAVPAGAGKQYWVTRQSTNGCGICALGTSTNTTICNSQTCKAGCLQTQFISNDVVGCGNYGAGTSACGSLNSFTGNLCGSISGLGGWNCNVPGTEAGLCESFTLLKSTPLNGGVLCCKDKGSVGCLDTDGDGVCDSKDNCIAVKNSNQLDTDGDHSGDACDPCPADKSIDSSNYKGTCPKPAPAPPAYGYY